MGFTRAILLGVVLLAIGLAKSGYAAPVEARAVPADEEVAVTPDSDKALGAGDTVSLEIVEDKAVPILKRISDTGDLDVPYIGRVHAAGKSCAEVAAQIKRQLEGKYYYKATVKLAIEQISPIKPGPITKVLVSGEVKTIGQQVIVPGDTVSSAIVKAGSATQFGNLKIVKLTRKNKDGSSQTFIIDVKSILENGNTDKDMKLQDGDSIFVPKKLFSI